MVWFQCEDCGENLKKPKLQNHFRVCSANRLSCIDCGEIFGQQNVQTHTQCITEAEKYGPKGQGKGSNNTPAKTNSNSKPKSDIDINVGLSSRAPWFCSLCNTSATSKQTLLLHAEGKKHRAKARAFHASKQPKQTEESNSNAKDVTIDPLKGESIGNKDVEEPKAQDSSKATVLHSNSEAENGSLSSKKKRKLHTSDDGSSGKKEGSDGSGDLSNGEVIQAKRAKAEPEGSVKKTKPVDVPKEDEIIVSDLSKEAKNKKIKWKKMITSVLKSNPDGSLKMRKLQKLVLKALEESGLSGDEAQLKDTLVYKINTSSQFTLDGKLVRLVAKS